MGACCSAPEERVTVVQQPAKPYPRAAYTPSLCPQAAPAYAPMPGYAAAPGYYAQPPPAYYPAPQPYGYPQSTVVVQQQRSGMSSGGAALMGGTAGFMGGMLLGEALAGPEYGYGGTTIIEGNNTFVENTTVIENNGWGGGDFVDSTVVVDDGGWGGDTMIVDNTVW